MHNSVSLSILSFANPSIATPICGPGDHWVDTCPSGIDEPVQHSGEMTLELDGIGEIEMDLDGGPFTVYRGESEDGPVTITPPPIPTEPVIPSECNRDS